MKRYVGLLRGVNVGGKNKVPMALLKSAFEEGGFLDVSTYINSGNILFSCGEEDPVILQQQCREIIMSTFRLDIPVAVISAADFSEALANAPDWWGNDSQSKQIAIFVIPPADAASMVREVGIKPEYESVAHYGQVIFWTAPIKTFSRTRWSNVIATPAYSSITIRGANTYKKLVQLCGL